MALVQVASFLGEPSRASVRLQSRNASSLPSKASGAQPTPITNPQVPCALRLLPGKTHTDLLLEDAFRGGPNTLADIILEAATGRPHSSWHPRTCPAALVWLAGRVCPF
jgi:hypothetical protein